MAIVKDYCINYTNKCELFYFEDKINWGSPEEDRSAGAHVLLAAHVSEKGEESFLTIDSTPYLTKTKFDINNSKDGHYLFELLRFPIYDLNASYTKEVKDSDDVITNYASLVFYPTTDKFYKAIDASLNQAPDGVDGALYWEEITDFTLDEIRASNQITIFEYRDVFLCRSRKCVKTALIDLGCGCTDMEKYLAYFKKKALLDGAQSMADDVKYEKAETIVRVLEKMCPSC